MWSVLAAAALTVLVSGHVYDTGFDSTWNDDQWLLSTSKLVQGQFQSRMSLANGYLGINVALSGPFFEVDTGNDLVNEWPLFDRRQTFATIAGFYDYQPTTEGTNFPWLRQYGGESVISGIPHWAGLYVQSDHSLLYSNVSASEISQFNTTLDVKRGLMHWRYTWTPAGGCPIDVEYSMFVHKLLVNSAAVQLKLTAHHDSNVTVIDVLQGDAAVRTNTASTHYDAHHPVIGSAVRPWGIDNITAHVYSTFVGDGSCCMSSRAQITNHSLIGGNSSSVGQGFQVRLKAGKPAVLHKYIGAASTDAFGDPQKAAWDASHAGVVCGWDSWLASHTKEWASILTPDTVDSFRFAQNDSLPNDTNIQELHITSVTNTYYLLQNTVGANAITAAHNNTKLDVNSIPVCGLGDSCYAGEIFWDSEVWMAPGLVVTNPQSTKQIARYRVEKYAQAQANIKTAYQGSEGNRTFSEDGAIFPWISSRYGNCTAVGPCWDYEYHINGDIGLEFHNYLVASGDVDFFKDQLFPIYEAITTMYADLVQWNETAQQYYLLNATDPDEFANNKNNVAYTMALIGTHLNNTNELRQLFGGQTNETWANISRQIAIPVDNNVGIIKEYLTMNGSISVKQADVILIDDFLHYPNPYTNNDLDYYAGKQSQNGPAMTYGVFSIVANTFSPSGCSSYTYDLYGSTPYLRAPWLQFSEQLNDDPAVTGFHPAFPFLTGMGGALRVSVFGYLGLQLRLSSFHVDPSLPPQIPQIRYRTLYWQGWPIQAYSNQTHTTLSRGCGLPLETANATFAHKSIPVTVGQMDTPYGLHPNSTITFDNRRNGFEKTVPGNLNQCRPVSSSSEYVKGQFPLGAVDGAVSTVWQPSALNRTSTMTVHLGDSYAMIQEVRFSWGQNVPESYHVSVSNYSDGSDARYVAGSDDIAISLPYEATNSAAIVQYQSNTTNVTLGRPVWSGRFATLAIAGNQALKGTSSEKNGTGATVAEFVLVAVES